MLNLLNFSNDLTEMGPLYVYEMTPLRLLFLTPKLIKVLLNQLGDFLLLRENKTLLGIEEWC